MRKATVKRATKETQIALTFHADGGPIDLNTGLPFFDHMLNALACHGRFGLEVEAKGDIEVDPHHLMEDVGIVLGQAIRDALPEYKGIARAGCFAFPMDATLAVVALDLCGRPTLVWNVEFGPFTLGGIDPNLFREFFKGLVDGMRASVHVHIPCRDNDHHLIEAVYKAFGRALRQAAEPVGAPDTVLSTKGMLDV